METWAWVYVFFVSTVELFAIVSNVLVIVSVVKFRKLRTVTNVLICNLAVSDILLGGFYLPQKLHDLSHAEYYFEGEALCKIVNSFPIFVITSSSYTLVCVSFERRRAILEFNKPQMTLTQLSKLIPFVWFSSFLVSFPTVFEFSIGELELPSTNINATNNTIKPPQLVCDNKSMPFGFVLFNGCMVLVVSFIVPQVVMFYNYIQLARFINRRAIEVGNSSTQGITGSNGISNRLTRTSSSHLSRNRLKLVQILVVVAIVFAVSWFPFYVLFIYMKVSHQDASNLDCSVLTLTVIALMALSTAYNVLLYVIFNKNFKQAIKKIICCQFNETWDIVDEIKPNNNANVVNVISIKATPQDQNTKTLK